MHNSGAFLFITLCWAFGLILLPDKTQAQASLLFPEKLSAPHCGYVEVPLSVQGVGSLVGIQFTVSWNPEEMEFAGIGRSDFPDIDVNSFGTRSVASGVLTFLWYDPYLNGVNIASEQVFFIIRLKLTAEPGTVTAIRVSGDPTPVIGYDSSGNILNITSNVGSIHALEEQNH